MSNKPADETSRSNRTANLRLAMMLGLLALAFFVGFIVVAAR